MLEITCEMIFKIQIIYLFAIKGKGIFFPNLAEMPLLLENSAVSRPNTEIPLPSSNSGGGRGSLRYSKQIIWRRK